jgi:hypothetical protein
MRSQFRKSLVLRLAGLAVPGAFVLGTSCVESIRESAVSGGLAFVEDSATAILDSLAAALLPASE